MTETNQKVRGRKDEVIGKVVSAKADKTIAVLIYRLVKHSKYGKYIRKSSVFKAHDEQNVAKTGDKVKIFATKPMSKTKRWKLAEVIETAAK